MAGDVALGVTSMVGLATTPPEPPNTNQLADVYQSQMDQRRSTSIEDASHEQGTSTSQNG